MSMDLQIQLVECPNARLLESVNALLRNHNQEKNPVYWRVSAKKENRPRPLNLFAYNSEELVIGGLLATTQLKWLKVNIMATRPEYRGQGIGLALLERAEAIALERGCAYAFVDTMEFQGPGFYEKAGYEQVGYLEDWDSHGHAKSFFRKTLQ